MIIFFLFFNGNCSNFPKLCYINSFFKGNRLCIILEYAPYGDLARAIRKGQTMKKPFPEDMIWSFFTQVRS